MKEISIYAWFGFSIPMEERFKLIKNAGFSSTFLWWGDEYKDIDGPKEKHPEMARKCGLCIENVHLPYEDANEIWTNSLESEDLLNRYMSAVEQCSNFNIPTAVLHLICGSNPPPPSEKGLDRIKILVELAEERNVNIALENLRKLEYLDYTFSGIQSPKLGFCYDSGHENCRTKGANLLSRYGSKLMALHLHDNDGTEDLHQVPGEGTIDWEITGRKLNETGYKGAIALEVTNEFSDYRGKETPQEFLARAYKSAKRLGGNVD